MRLAGLFLFDAVGIYFPAAQGGRPLLLHRAIPEVRDAGWPTSFSTSCRATSSVYLGGHSSRKDRHDIHRQMRRAIVLGAFISVSHACLRA
jgi:hypothetical protein